MRIGVIRYWAGRPAAEHEVIARLAVAARNRGHDIIELNPDGSSLADPTTTPQLDMVLNLHYASPKSLDVPHVGALWNPLEFYHKFGFVPHFANQLSHDYLATCGSRVVEAAVAPFRPDLFADGRHLPRLNHTVPERYLPPGHRNDRRLFYVGVNWEKLGNQAGRHDDLLYLLDAADSTSIYGPRLIDGVAPWAGYRTYRGDLPFDGWSVVTAIERAGSALVTSSPAHYRDGVMSCRPFEAAAAGVPIISERHPFMVEHFDGAVLFYDERAPVAEQAAEIEDLLLQLNKEPDLAFELATKAQGIVRDQFNLDDQLDRLCTWVSDQQPASADSLIDATAVLVPSTGVEDFSSWVTRNADVLAQFSRVILAPPARGPAWSTIAKDLPPNTRLEVRTRSDTGWSERAVLAAMQAEGTICFLAGLEALHHRYPSAVRDAVLSSTAGVVPAVAIPAASKREANARLPRLLCGSTSPWWDLPVASIVTTVERVRELVGLLGPGLHLGALAAEAMEQDALHPRFNPALSVVDVSPSDWSLLALEGDSRHADALYAQALPPHLTTSLPRSLLTREPAFVVPPRGPLRTRLADAVRRSALPEPMVNAMISAGRAALRPSRPPKGRRKID